VCHLTAHGPPKKHYNNMSVGAEATKRLLKVCWTTFLALLQGESVDQAAETGPLVVVLDLASQLHDRIK
jgi:hypothetical protein